MCEKIFRDFSVNCPQKVLRSYLDLEQLGPRMVIITMPWAIIRFRIFSNYFSQKFEKIKIKNNLKITNIKIAKDGLVDYFIYEFFLSFF